MCCDGQIVGGALPVPAAGAGVVIGAPFYTGFLGFSDPEAPTAALTIAPATLNPGARYTVQGSHDGTHWQNIAVFITGQPPEIPILGAFAHMRILREDPIAGVPTMGLVGQMACDCTGGGGGGCVGQHVLDGRQEDEGSALLADGEVVIAEWQDNLNNFAALVAANMSITLTCLARADGVNVLGNVRIRIRSGGTPGAPDGAILLSANVVAANVAAPLGTAVFALVASVAKISGNQDLKLTIEAINASTFAAVRAAVVQFGCPQIL